ncbi:MAG: YbaN family protein [Paracoccus sp. (in: a-proteobacteria)]|nr:YbaN family protein [Paracoccus sp. (in: a-proteobacteria)]
MTRLIWLVIGWIAVGCAVIGALLPIIPTVPFLLVALWAFGKSSERLRQRLLNDPIFGPDIRRWQERGAIRRSAKILAVLAMLGSVLIGFLIAPVQLVLIQAAILVCAAIFILTRPDS